MQGVDPRTDGELLVASRADPQAFAIFYRRHERAMHAFFGRRVRDAALTHELSERTFAAAFEAAPRYELRPEPARDWLYGIAWSILDEARRPVDGAQPPLRAA